MRRLEGRGFSSRRLQHPLRRPSSGGNKNIRINLSALSGVSVGGVWNGYFPELRSHLGTLALKTEDFINKIGHFSKTQKWIY